MKKSLPAAWSNGQWIWLDLNENRYIGGGFERDSRLQALQALAGARLRSVIYREKPLIPPLHIVGHFVRSSRRAKKFSKLRIVDQLAALENSSKQPPNNHSVETLCWYYQYLRNLRVRRPLCLEDSLACAFFLRRYITGVSFRIGVKQPPFMAHAWVQVGELIANDTKPVVETYSEILRLDL
ncbi:lasso peptide biosynthesis B2 protein [Rhizobium rhizogenes]|uniref:lasso peptide biosynthesis B2 protein n=1 Tax=Rhizobium rhizogenes TaxID=359 RepID=UPI00386E02B4